MISERPDQRGEAEGEQASLERRLRERTEELAQARRDLEQISVDDELTGLYNLRGFLLLAEQVRMLTRRNWQTASLIWCKLDGVDALTREQGTEAAEQMVVGAAALLRENLREEDVVARVDTSVFAVFASIPPENTDTVRSRLSSCCDAINAEQPNLPCRLSLSFGFASVSPSDGRSLTDLLAVAGGRLHETDRPERAA